MPMVTLARHAMATRFELVLHGADPVGLRAAGEEALDEIDHLEAELSLFRPGSQIAHLNARAAREPVRVTPEVFSLLEQAKKLNAETGDAFDISIAPLMRCWGFMGGTGRRPEPEELAAARACVGMHLVELNPRDLTVRFMRSGVMLDLGAMGKGYAIERAAELLGEAGITSALIHGGTSTVYALGKPPDEDAWRVAVDRPGAGEQGGAPPPETAASPPPLAVVALKDEAMSVSGIRGKFFEAEGRVYGHILDPRSGEPATAAALAVVVLPSATETDALSTALLTLGPEGHEQIASLRPGMKSLVVSETGGRLRTVGRGISLEPVP